MWLHNLPGVKLRTLNDVFMVLIRFIKDLVILALFSQLSLKKI